MPGHRGKGLRYEDRARNFLERRGLTCVARNFRSRFGEIDLIMRDRQTLCFVEVKYRQSLGFGGAAHAITASQQKRIIQTALAYLASQPNRSDPPLRFDALLIQREADGNESFDWIQSAFSAEC